MGIRRAFTRDQREAIRLRATDETGTIRCENCGGALKAGQYEIDHIIAEALRPEADKARKLTIADGQLLGTLCCHRGPDGKTAKDVAQIAKAKAQSQVHRGIRPVAKMKSRPGPISERTARNDANPKRRLQPRQIYHATERQGDRHEQG